MNTNGANFRKNKITMSWGLQDCQSDKIKCIKWNFDFGYDYIKCKPHETEESSYRRETVETQYFNNI